ncbi:hypothetical protein NST66_11095 [Priestia sp. FSL W8-0524]|uniref:hypothetical protein n=1 Tax=Priestia sp. FSL W8-0524 TaxID=2954625 RepID=UPI0030F871AA
MTLFKDMISKLTDLFTKNENSNIGKIIRVFSDELEQVQATLEKTEQWRDIDDAEGTTLDLIGENVGQMRDNSSDEQFRLLIKTKIFSNLSVGDIESVNQLLRIYLGDQFVSVEEGWQLEGTPFDGQAAMLFITVKGDGNLNGIPFEHTSRIVGDGIGTTWNYVFERALLTERSYKRWVFPYENFTGQMVAGTEEVIPNQNRLYQQSLGISSSYVAAFNEYVIASENTIMGDNIALFVGQDLTLSRFYAATQNDYQLCGGLEENQATQYQAGIDCQRGYFALDQPYPICGETNAEGVR